MGKKKKGSLNDRSLSPLEAVREEPRFSFNYIFLPLSPNVAVGLLAADGAARSSSLRALFPTATGFHRHLICQGAPSRKKLWSSDGFLRAVTPAASSLSRILFVHT